MSEKPPAVYSCPSCGALSQIDLSLGDGSICRECGYQFRRPVHVAPRNSSGPGAGAGRFVQRDVVSRRRQVVREKTVMPPDRQLPAELDAIEETGGGRREDEVVSSDGHKKVIRRRKKRRKPVSSRSFSLGVIWISGIIGVLVFFGQRVRKDSESEVPAVPAEDAARHEQRAKMQAYVDSHIEECHRVLSDFWRAPDVPQRAQYVYQPGRVAPLMTSYSRQHGLQTPAGKARVTRSNLIMGDGYRAIETIWMDDQGKRFEVVFVRDEGSWLIDWEQYVQYSSTRWDLFVSGAIEEIEEVGDFRIFMREMPPLDEDDGRHIRVKFHPADYELKNRQKGDSPTVMVPVDSALGSKVRAALDDLDRTVQPGVPVAWKEDPKGMARVRVLLEWRPDPANTKRRLCLNDLKANSWLAEELVEPSVPPIAKDGGERDEKE